MGRGDWHILAAVQLGCLRKYGGNRRMHGHHGVHLLRLVSEQAGRLTLGGHCGVSVATWHLLRPRALGENQTGWVHKMEECA